MSARGQCGSLRLPLHGPLLQSLLLLLRQTCQAQYVGSRSALLRQRPGIAEDHPAPVAIPGADQRFDCEVIELDSASDHPAFLRGYNRIHIDLPSGQTPSRRLELLPCTPKPVHVFRFISSSRRGKSAPGFQSAVATCMTTSCQDTPDGTAQHTSPMPDSTR